MAADKFLIAGLGNIGAEYVGTRHNMGFMVADSLAEEAGVLFVPSRLGSIATITYKGNKLILLKPSTYINLSGRAVSYWVQEENIKPGNLLVVCDDINLPFGVLRMRKAGSDGGHNGLANISEHLQTTEYCRLRVGVGSDFSRGGQIDYVLGRIEGEELASLPALLKRATCAVKDFAFLGPDRTMNLYNTMPHEESESQEEA